MSLFVVGYCASQALHIKCWMSKHAGSNSTPPVVSALEAPKITGIGLCRMQFRARRAVVDVLQSSFSLVKTIIVSFKASITNVTVCTTLQGDPECVLRSMPESSQERRIASLMGTCAISQSGQLEDTQTNKLVLLSADRATGRAELCRRCIRGEAKYKLI